MKKIKITLLAALIGAGKLMAQSAYTTVQFNVQQFDPAAWQTTCYLTPIVNPQTASNTIISGGIVSFPLTNNAPLNEQLWPGPYTMSLAGVNASWTLNVPSSTNVINAANVVSNLPAYNPISLPGVNQLAAGPGVTLTPASGQGSLVTIDSSRGTTTTTNFLYGNMNNSLAFMQNQISGMANGASNWFGIMLLGNSLNENKFDDDNFKDYFRTRGFLQGVFHPAGDWTAYNGATYDQTNFPEFVNGFVNHLPAGSSNVLAGEQTTYQGNYVTFYWLRFTNAGNLMVYSTTNPPGGGVYLGTLSGGAAVGTNLSSQSFSLTPGFYSFIVIGTNATTDFAGGTVQDTRWPGAVLYPLAHGGTSMQQQSECMTNVLNEIGSGFAPQLILVENLTSASDWSNYWPQIATNVFATLSNCDACLVSPNVGGWTNDAWVNIPQSQYMLNWVEDQSSNVTGPDYSYFDQHALWGNWTNAVNMGFMTNDWTNPHPTFAGRNNEIQSFFDWTHLSDVLKSQSYAGALNFVSGDPATVTTWNTSSGNTAVDYKTFCGGNGNVVYAQMDAAGNLLGGVVLGSQSVQITGGNSTQSALEIYPPYGRVNVDNWLDVQGGGGQTGHFGTLGAHLAGEVDMNYLAVTNAADIPTNYVGYLTVTNSLSFSGGAPFPSALPAFWPSNAAGDLYWVTATTTNKIAGP
ncbi:MAG: hypothetical protein KGR98_09210 [Verrucomicrobia bacterium]|nr:hypothetical protein [Verrucomicrobiota bacterium]MDE3098623.1 hypothetical protein [Verrucomicrobiota bacterium]